MGRETRHFMDEDDIGSGEKVGSGHEDVQHDIEAIRAAQAGGIEDGSQIKTVIEEQQYAERRSDKEAEGVLPERVIQSGSHVARAACRKLEDETFEAQVFVRLTREPQVAETYIPAGIFTTAEQALAAAEERARRAIDHNEF